MLQWLFFFAYLFKILHRHNDVRVLLEQRQKEKSDQAGVINVNTCQRIAVP